MEQLSDKISTLQKNFYDLNSLFDLSIIATQAESLEDLIEKISEFLTQTLNIENANAGSSWPPDSTPLNYSAIQLDVDMSKITLSGEASKDILNLLGSTGNNYTPIE